MSAGGGRMAGGGGGDDLAVQAEHHRMTGTSHKLFTVVHASWIAVDP